MFNREFRLPFLYILRFQCMDINTRLRTDTFSHQFGLPRKSRNSYSNSISSNSNERRRSRQKLRGLSPLPNSHNINSSSLGSTVESPNVQAESPSEKSINKEEVKTVEEEPTGHTNETSDNSLIPSLLSSLQLPSTKDEDDLLKNNPPRPSQLMSHRASLASTRSNYDTYIPNLNIEYSRSPQLTPSSASGDVKTWTRAREFKPSQIPQERFRRRSEALSDVGKKLSMEQISIL
ncbi:hypothetical protein Aperf_G00000126271 [Anoplocephala perfoliata]